MWPENLSEPQFGGEHPEGELAAFALNALDDAEFQAVFHHVVRCPHCQEVLLGFREAAARLTEAAPEADLPAGLKSRVLAAATGVVPDTSPARAASLPPPDRRWSVRRLRRWLAPVAIGALSLLLAASIGFMVSQQREISQLTAANEAAPQSQPAAIAAAPSRNDPGPVAPSGEIAAPAPAVVLETTTPGTVQQSQAIPVTRAASSLNLTRGGGAARSAAVAAVADTPETRDADAVDHVKQEMSDVVEATVLSAQPETEKLPMKSPMGTEPEAKGVLMIDPSGRQGVLMVSGMPADSYQIWLVRDDKRMLVDRIVVNEDDGSGVKQFELDESVFGFQEVALMPDERHGPSNPTGENFLTARIITGPPIPPPLNRER